MKGRRWSGGSAGRSKTNQACSAAVLLAGTLVLVGTAGCDVPIGAFESNQLFAKRLELNEQVDLDRVRTDAQEILESLFGTPNQPNWPEFLAGDPELRGLISTDGLQRAAGAVRSDESGTHFGLYREHCILCHGISGNGLGATSRLLNPYPRDFRMGKFKFKSTPIGSRPTRDDLTRLLKQGIAGTSMPSFRLLAEEDLSALVDYVIYLSIRGEVERDLLLRGTYDIDSAAGERLIDLHNPAGDPAQAQPQGSEIQAAVRNIARNWATANEKRLTDIVPPADLPLVGQSLESQAEKQRLTESIARGRELFQGKVANCASCHGVEAAGDGVVNDYDEWTKDWTLQAGLDPQDTQQLQPMLELGALKPRPILPRNLQTGIYRGGSSPQDLYRRIVLGIEGTPMPAAPMQPEIAVGLSQENVWDLVNFLLSLPNQSTTHEPSPTGSQL